MGVMVELSGELKNTFWPLWSGSSQRLLSALTVESIRNQGGSSEPQSHSRASFQLLQRDSVKAKPAMARSEVQLKACSYILPAGPSLLL